MSRTLEAYAQIVKGSRDALEQTVASQAAMIEELNGQLKATQEQLRAVEDQLKAAKDENTSVKEVVKSLEQKLEIGTLDWAKISKVLDENGFVVEMGQSGKVVIKPRSLPTDVDPPSLSEFMNRLEKRINELDDARRDDEMKRLRAQIDERRIPRKVGP